MKNLLTSAGLIATFFIGGLALGQTGPPKPPPPKAPMPPCAWLPNGGSCRNAPTAGECYLCCDDLCSGLANTQCHQGCDDHW